MKEKGLEEKRKVFQLNQSLVITLPKGLFSKGEYVMQIPTEQGILISKVKKDG